MSSAKRKNVQNIQNQRRRRRRIRRRRQKELSDLPEELKLRILGCLDTKQAVQTTILSKSWLSLWTRIPVLQFNRFSFVCGLAFHKFVRKVLSRRDPLAKLDTLKFNYMNTDDGWCIEKFAKRVFEYAFSHGVKHLEASIEELNEDNSSCWPVRVCDSLTGLKLESKNQYIRCPFLAGPARSHVLFKNLTVLYLEGAEITDDEPFSGFRVLESLTLLNCYFDIAKGDHQISKTLKVHALRLSDLTISDCIGEAQCLDLSTPRLRFLECHGYELLKHEGLPVLETLEINFDGFNFHYKDKEAEKRMIDDLISLFSTLPNIKSLTLFASTVLLLSLFPDELVRRGGSPFRELKDLKLDLSDVYITPTLFHKPCDRWYNFVTAYLLHNSPDAEFTLTYPEDIDDMEWFDDDPWETLLKQLDYPKK